MKKFNLEDWDIEPELDINRDDLIYGNYVDWNRFRIENEENLLDYFEIYLPWSKKLSVSEYIEFISQDFFKNTNLLDKYEFNELLICKQGSKLSDLQIQFVNREGIDSKSLVSDIFDYYGVPIGVDYEQELPEELQYWSNQLEGDYLDNEYEYYKSYPIEIVDYIDTISEIELKINNCSDELVIKSLILSSLIISESLIKSIIANKLPKEKDLSDFSKKIIEKAINDKLRKFEGRNELFKDVFGVKSPKQDWINLRNSLAHDIESSKLTEGKITYVTSKGNEHFYEIEKLFKNLSQFSEDLQAIIS